MYIMKNVALAVSMVTVLLVPALCSGAEKIIPPLVGMVKEGKATFSANQKTLVDEKGNIVAREIDVAKSPDAGKESKSKSKTITICNYKCAIITRRCYADDSGTIVCINMCDKQALICEEVAP